MISNARIAASAIAALLVSVSTQAMAQNEATDDEAVGVGDILVTAERREVSQQDVPISATVLTGEELASKGVVNLNDIQQVAPSIAINTFNRSTFVNIRGVGIAQSAPTSNPGVAYYIDGQLIPHEQFIGHSFYDIATIEVLRGPQGTLTGQNSTGGAIYVRTPEPEFGAVSAAGDFTVANYDRYRGVVAANIGGENVALRVAAMHEQRDSFTQNIGGSGSQPGNLDMDAIRGNLKFRTEDDRLNVWLRGEFFDVRTDNNAVKNRNDAVTDDPFVIEEDGRSYMNQKGYRLSGEARYDLSDAVQARGLVSWQDGYTHDQTDGDRTATALPVPAGLPATGGNRALYPGRVSNASTDFETLIGEVNLLSTGDGPLQWVAGAFILDESVPVELYRDNYHTTDFVESNSDIVATAHNKSKSLFGQFNFFATDSIELIAGARHSWDSQEYIRYAVPGPTPLPYISTATSTEWTGKLGASYHFADNNMLYLSASKGYKAGGVNLTPATPDFGPETNFVYEAGFKLEFLDHQLRVNGDVFYSDYHDIQLSSLVGGLPVTQNALSGEAKGAELEITGRFGGLGFNLGLGYLDAKFANSDCISDTNSPGTDAGCPTNLRFVPEGRRLPFSPKLTANAGIQYTLPAGSFDITPRLQWSHVSDQYATPFPSFNTLVPGHDLLDARVTFDFGRYQIDAFANNLTDEVYVATQIQNSSSANGGIIYGAPRTYGLRLRVMFGD